MEKVVRKFASHQEAAEADRQEDRGLTPQQRMDMMLELFARGCRKPDGTFPRLERVFTVVQLSRR